MKNFVTMLLALGVFAAVSFGCAEMKIKTIDVKCPKCGATFTVDEETHLKSLGFGNP